MEDGARDVSGRLLRRSGLWPFGTRPRRFPRPTRTTGRMSRLIAMAILLFSVSAAGQTVTLAPPSLTTATRVGVTFHSNACRPFERLVRNGDVFDVEYHVESACITTPSLVDRELDLGFLDAGSFTVRTIDATNPGAPVVTGTVPFAVAQVQAVRPALDAKGIGILLLAIAISVSLAVRGAVA
jgi:hypothetical protein